MKNFSRVFTGFFLGVSLTLSLFVYTIASAAPNFEYLDLFAKVLHYVQANYVEEVDTKKLVEGAIKGMLSTLDPHTVYMPAEQFKEMQVDTQGKFGGLGIEITVTDGYLTVVTPIEDTPAFFAGVEPGDRIMMIEDKIKKIKKETKGMTLNEAVTLMRGEKGSKVTVHVARKNQEKLIPLELKRDIIKVVAVKGGMIEQDYAWLRITNFQANTSRDLRSKLEGLIRENKKPLQGIVLDLRSNPGGLLLDKLPIVSTIGRKKDKKEVEFSRGENPYKDFKIVVLVNESSASASEIVAGALQDHKRGLIVGKTTFGKGSVQTVIDMENKAGLKLTIARYYTPSGRTIQSKGITPDIEVDRIDLAEINKNKKSKALREADLENHLINETGEPSKKEEDKLVASSDKEDKRPIREKDGKKLRVEDPKEFIKTDFQLQQALSYLKVWNVFEVAKKKDPSPEKSDKSAVATKPDEKSKSDVQ